MALILLAALTLARAGEQSQGYVQSATPGSVLVDDGERVPLRRFARLTPVVFIQAPKGGEIVVVFRSTGDRFRLRGPGQAKITEQGIRPVSGARIDRLGKMDLRLLENARRDGRFGQKTGAETQAATAEASDEGVPGGPVPQAEPEPSTPLPPVPPLVLPVSPEGLLRERPTEIVLRPAPPDGEVTLRWRAPISRRRDDDRATARMVNGVIQVPPGMFAGDEFVLYSVFSGQKRLADGDARVLTPSQRAELQKAERAAESAGDDESLMELAMLYADLRMRMDQDRILRRLLARHPNDPGFHEELEFLVRLFGARR